MLAAFILTRIWISSEPLSYLCQPNLTRIWRSLLDCSLSCATFLWISYASSLQLNEDTKVLAELVYYIVTFLWVWYAGSLLMDEDKEVPGKVLSYLCRCPLGLV
jgi:hypothetical protein